MRARTLIAAILVVAPSALSAQRIPLPIGRRGPARPEPLPPQPYPVAQQLAYTRSHLSIETYPMVEFISAPGLAGNGRPGSWASLGAGSHVDYRLTRFMSGTLDLTSSLFGGPVTTQTAELGTRFHAERGTSRWYPYMDFRVGYIATHASFGTIENDVFVDPSTAGYYSRYSQGYGGIAGAGLEYALTRMFSITTGASLLHGRLSMSNLADPTVENRHFTMNSLRYTLGIRFNPVHAIYGGNSGNREKGGGR
jgi:hypothetical protein